MPSQTLVSHSGNLTKNYGSESIIVKQPISEARIEALRTEMVDMVTEQLRLKKELKAIQTDYKNKIKNCDAVIVDNAQILKEGYEDKETLCTKVPDFEAMVMEFYDDEGVRVFTRKLRPDERTPLL